MPISEILEAATVAEVVSPAGEAAVPVDLSVVSRQLDRLEVLLTSIDFGQMVLVGVLLGVGISLLLAVMFRG